MAAAANPNPPSISSATTDVSTTASPPWNVVVAENPQESGDKKPAWNKKPVSTPTLMIGDEAESGGAAVVMGAELWPSLSECTKSSPKISSSSSSDSSMNVPEVTGINTSSSTTVLMSVKSPSSISQKQTISNSNHHLPSNHARPARQKSFKGGNSQGNGVLSHQSSQLAGEGAHYHHNQGSPKPNSGGSENPGRDNVQNNSHRESGQRNASGDHPHQRNPFRKGNGGPHSRGDGSHHNFGGRRSDQERGNHDLNHQRSFNGRDASMQPRGVPKSFVRAPPVPAPFVYAPPLPPFHTPVLLPPGMQFVSPIYFPVPGPELYSELMKQINYYFSIENLVKDTYLRDQMDENGWVPVDVIAKFNRVKYLTKDTFQILEAVRPSTVVEVQGDKIRKRDDWQRWVLPPSVKFPTSSGSQSPKGPTVSAITDHIQSASLDEKTDYPSNVKDQVDGSAATLQASSGDSKSASRIGVVEANPNGR